MSVQSAEVKALLTLDSKGFDDGISKALKNIEKLDTGVAKSKESYSTLSSSIRAFSQELNVLSKAIEHSWKVSNEQALSFNRVATGMAKLVDSARSLAQGNLSLKGTYQHMENVVKMFANALSGVEVKMKGNVAVTREVVSSTNNVVRATNQYNTALTNPAIPSFRAKISGLSTTLASVNSTTNSTTNSVRKLNTTLSTSTSSISTFNTGINSLVTNLTKSSTSIERTRAELIKLSSQSSGYGTFLSQINEVRSALMGLEGQATKTNTSLKTGVSASGGYGSYLSNINQVNASLSKLDAQQTKTGNSSRMMGSQIQSASNSSSTARTRFNGLTQSLGMLRNAVTMVGSMFAYNFAHNLMISVQNTVKAKSEMLSFLHTMGMTEGQIGSFNKALDQTANRFQRINKYNIGETVANIGLEFDLSAKEMEKAMSVTSMVTSEYLRAGRNADEAALAVKDIMQGQFQRLSRETGVKGEQLKEAGWSGDTNDVMGLLDALEKVATSRHWDTFAQKASSLNDITLITQARFSEWATDISEGFTPIITESFNMLINGIDRVTSLFGKIGSALNLPDWAGTAALVGGLTTAIIGLVGATITWRTGMGLTQIAQQGLGQSILATIFNIKAEELANIKASTAIKAKILGLETEKVAQIGIKGAIADSLIVERANQIAKEASAASSASKISLLNAETLAEETGISVKQAKKLIQEQENLQDMKTITLLITKVLRLNAETVAEEGLTAAIGRNTVQRLVNAGAINAERAAEMGVNAARVIGIATLGAYAIAIAAVIAVVAPLAIAMNNAAQEMDKFNNLVNKGDEVIKDAKSTMESYSEKVSKLKSELAGLERGSQAYANKQYELKTAQEDLTTATSNYEQAIKAVEQARSAQSKFEQTETQIAIDHQQALATQLQQTGLSYEQAQEKASEYYSTVANGVATLNDIAGYEAYDSNRTLQRNAVIIDQFKGDNEKIQQEISYSEQLHKRLQENYKKMNSETTFSGRLDSWLGFEATQVEIWWDDLNNAFESQDWGSLGKSIQTGLDSIQVMDDFAWWFWSLFGVDKNTDALGIISDTINDMGKFISDAFSGLGKILDIGGEVISGLFGGIWDAFTGLFSGDGSGSGGLAKKIDPIAMLNGLFGGINFESITTYFTENILTPISEFLSTFDIASFLSTIGGMGGSFIMKLLGLDGVDVGLVVQEKLMGVITFITSFVSTITSTIMNLPNTLWGYLNQGIQYVMQFGSSLLQNGISAGSNLLNGVVTYVSQLPNRVFSYITQTASRIISGASQWVSNARSKATETVNAVVTQVTQLPNKVYTEFMNIANRIRDSISNAVRAATQFGSDVVNAVLGALHINSPGIIQNKIATEFANIPSRISENNSNAQSQASSFGQSIVDGMATQIPLLQQQSQAISNAMNVQANAQAVDFSGQFVGDYQTDANTVSMLNTQMTTDTTTTFGLMGQTVNSTISGISTNLQTSYATMNTSQTTALTTMQNQNKTAYTNLQSQTTSSLNNMRSTTQNVTTQMVGAWNHMKDNIIHSADQLKSQSTAHFNTLSNNIGGFYRKLQNPSMWGGSGNNVPTRYYNHSRGQRGINAVRSAFGLPKGHYGGGPSPDNLPETMTLRKLKSLLGNDSLFKNTDLSQTVNVVDFLSQFEGGFGWSDWNSKHFNHIKSKSGEWNMQGPMIMHRIPTGQSFKVKEFYNSRPSISFGSFQSMAEALFSAIPYDFYYNSDKYGSWQGALQAGSCNCYDGANALIALAATCGFGGTLAHGTWNGVPHVYAVINGKKMDTTGWQQRRSWNGVSAGSPSSNANIGNKTTNINISFDGAVINGEEDFRDRMRDIAQEVLREEVNTSITVGI